MASNRTSALVLWVVIGVMASVAGPTPAAATHGVPFFDDFSDMNFSDDMPVSWQPGFNPVILDASSGDLVLTSSSSARGAFAGGDPNVTGPLLYADISVRTQLRILSGEPGGGGPQGVGLFVGRGGVTPTSGYEGSIRPDGTIFIRRIDPSPAVALASTMTVLDVFNSDINLRFDLLGDTLSMWAWAHGTLEPVMPQLMVTDLTPITGIGADEAVVQLAGQLAPVGSFSTTVFRFVDVRIIPEPSTALLLGLGLVGLAARKETRSLVQS